METDSKQLLREILGLDDALGLDDRALGALQGMLKSRGGMGFLRRAAESEPESEDEELAAEEEERLAKGKSGHGLTELCWLYTRGMPEQVLRLTEVFLPKPDDHIIRQKMEKYNKVRMPNLKDIVDPDPQDLKRQAERKRSIKADLKEASSRLKHQAKKPVLSSVMLGDLNFLLG